MRVTLARVREGKGKDIREWRKRGEEGGTKWREMSKGGEEERKLGRGREG